MRLALESIDQASQRMSTIIGDLLFMARPVEQPQAHVDVSTILTSTVALLRAGIPECPHVTLDVDTLPPVSGYSSKLGQVDRKLPSEAHNGTLTRVRRGRKRVLGVRATT